MSEGNGTNGKPRAETQNTITVVSPLTGATMDVVPGNPGNKGGGRTPGSVIEYCRDLLMEPKTQDQAKAILEDKDHPHFASMWRNVAKYGTMNAPGESQDVNVISFTLNIGTREDR